MSFKYFSLMQFLIVFYGVKNVKFIGTVSNNFSNINLYFLDPLHQQKCSVCSKDYSTQAKLNLHMKHHTGDLLECAVCGKRFAGSFQLKEHLATHLGQGKGRKKPVCAICGFSLRVGNNKTGFRGSLVSHYQECHPEVSDTCPM